MGTNQTARLGVLFRQYAETGDEAVFAAFLPAATPMFASVAWRVAYENGGATRERIEDQLREIALRLTSNRKEISKSLPPSPALTEAYLLKLVANVCREDWKSGRIEARATQGGGAFENRLVDAGFTSEDVLELLWRADALIPHDRVDRSIFFFHYKHGFSASEIAGIKGLRLSKKDVERRLLCITRDLKRSLQAAGKEEPRHHLLVDQRAELLSKKYSLGLTPMEAKALAQIDMELQLEERNKADSSDIRASGDQRLARIESALSRVEQAITDLENKESGGSA